MKNINYVINGVLAIAVFILFILHFTGKNNIIPSSGTVMTTSEENMLSMPVAYINVDSLLDNYYFSVDLREGITRKVENMRANFVQQERNLQAEAEGFELKMKTGAFLTQQRAEQEQRRLEQRYAELQASAERQSLELNEENQRINMQLRDTIMAHLKEYNQMKGFQIIYSNSSESIISPILWAEDMYNITSEFTDYLNKKSTSQGSN